MQSPTAASESCNSNGGSRWLNKTCGAVWLARLPSFSSWRNSLPITMSSSSLNIVLNTTVTLSLLASTYLDKNYNGGLTIKITVRSRDVNRYISYIVSSSRYWITALFCTGLPGESQYSSWKSKYFSKTLAKQCLFNRATFLTNASQSSGNFSRSMRTDTL